MTNNKDYLSQEEIDALLKQASNDQTDNSTPQVDDHLNSMEQDALGEIGNITFGSAATALSTLLGKKVEITTPQVSVIPRSVLEEEFPKPHVAVHVRYTDGFDAINLLVIKTKDAQVIADIMMGGDGTAVMEELSEIHISAVQEAMNQMMGSSATSMSTIFNRFVNISPPGIDILDIAKGEGTEQIPNEDVLVKISFRLKIENLIDSSIMQLLPIWFAKEMVSTLLEGNDVDGYAEQEQENYAEPAREERQPNHAVQPEMYQQPAYQPPVNNPPLSPQQPPNVHQQPMYAQQPAQYGHSTSAEGRSAVSNRHVNVQAAQFTNLTAGPSMRAEETNLDLLLDVPLKVTVELGRTKKLVKEILELSQNSIIELDKLAGEPVDILVNNKLIAKGEVVVIDENFGVRVTDIVNQWDRIRKLQ